MGNTSISLIVLVGLLVIGGLVNYERNAALDAPLADRPYAEVDRDTLDQLVKTHEAQLAELTAWVAESPDASVPRQELAPSDLGGKWKLGIKVDYTGKVTGRSGCHEEGDTVPHPDQLLPQVPDIPAGAPVFGCRDLTLVNDQYM